MYKILFCKHTCNFSNVMFSCVQFLMHTKTAIVDVFLCEIYAGNKEYLYFPG